MCVDSRILAGTTGRPYIIRTPNHSPTHYTPHTPPFTPTVPKKVRAFEELEVTGLAAGGNHSLFAVAFPGHWVVEGRYGEKLKTPARVLEAWACGFGQWGALADRCARV